MCGGRPHVRRAAQLAESSPMCGRRYSRQGNVGGAARGAPCAGPLAGPLRDQGRPQRQAGAILRHELAKPVHSADKFLSCHILITVLIQEILNTPIER